MSSDDRELLESVNRLYDCIDNISNIPQNLLNNVYGHHYIRISKEFKDKHQVQITWINEEAFVYSTGESLSVHFRYPRLLQVLNYMAPAIRARTN